mgnify:CR=1 FL=1
MLRNFLLSFLFVFTGSFLFGDSFDEEEFSQIYFSDLELNPDWLVSDVERQSKVCIATAVQTVNIDSVKEPALFTPPKTVEAKQNWCQLLGQKLYNMHNQRSILPAILKELVNNIYAGITDQSTSSHQVLWLSKHNICIDAWKSICFN